MNLDFIIEWLLLWAIAFTLYSLILYKIRGAETLAKNALEETNALHRLLRRVERRLEDLELLAVSLSKRLNDDDENPEGENTNE